MVGRFLLTIRLLGKERRGHSGLVGLVVGGEVPAAEAWLFSHLEGVREGIRGLVAAADGDPTAGARSEGAGVLSLR